MSNTAHGGLTIMLLVARSVVGCGVGDPVVGVEDRPRDDTATPLEDSGLRWWNGGSQESHFEDCDGVDNDEDGEIDEGFPDLDGDGHMDCVDLACEVEEAEADARTLETACEPSVAPALEPWDVEVVMAAFEQDASTVCADTIADLNGDGEYELLFAWYDTLHVVDAQTGTSLRSIDLPGNSFDAPWVVGDGDRDGLLDVFMLDEDSYVLASDGAGNTLWTSDMSLGPLLAGKTTALQAKGFRLYLDDLDGDGHAEVWNHKGAISAADGEGGMLLDQVDDSNAGGAFHIAVAADLDLDGDQEIVHNMRILDLDGSLLWDEAVDASYEKMANPILAQVDDDDAPELVWLTQTGFSVRDDDGTVLAEDDTIKWSEHRKRNVSLMCAGDFDADGLMELAYPDGDYLRAIDDDGNQLWSTPIEDPSGGGACSVFDFDLDGRHEILHTDERQLSIRDGLTGQALYADRDWDSVTNLEHALVVDLDHDGSVEIIGISTGGHDNVPSPRIKIYSHADRAWPPGFPGWYGTNWSGVGRRSDGRIPHTADASWLETGIWRGQPATPGIGMDLRPEVVDACISSCELEEAEVRLAVRVANVGSEEAHEEGRLGVYLLDEEGQPTLHRLYEVEEVYPPAAASDEGDTGTADGPEPLGFIDEGAVSPTVEIVLTLAQSRHGVRLVAGDDGSGTSRVDDFECAEDDNVITWRPEACDDAAE